MGSGGGREFLRSEVEELVRSKHGERGLEDRMASAELARVEREMKRLRRQLAALEQRRSELLAALEQRRSELLAAQGR